MGTRNLCIEQIYEKYQIFLSENFHFLVVKFSVYLNRLVFVMVDPNGTARYHLDIHCFQRYLFCLKG